MSTAHGFLLAILLATVVTNATTRAEKPPNQRRGLIGFVAKRGRHWPALMAKPHLAAGRVNKRPINGGPKPQDISALRFSKLCLNIGPCFKKRLVCPKKCRAPGRVENIHALTRCIFDCNNCIAYC
ncbi:hypothetical protein ACLOJK_017044 [Asimina triloba]